MLEDIESFPIGNQEFTQNILDYHNKIASAWHKTTQGILETASMLLEAKQNLNASEWSKLRRQLEDERIMSKSVISKLLGIAENKVLSNPEYQKYLPPSYATLYMMKDKDDEILIEKIRNGEITPSLQQKEVIDIFYSEKRENTLNETNTFSKIIVSGDFTKIPQEEYSKIIEMLNFLKKYGINIKGLDFEN